MTTIERNRAIKKLLEKKAPTKMSEKERIRAAKTRLQKAGIYTAAGQLKKPYK